VIVIPYVKQERRPALDKVVRAMSKIDFRAQDLVILLHLFKHWEEIDRHSDKFSEAAKTAKEINVEPNGDLNYILFKWCKYHEEPSYNNYKRIIGLIHRAMDDFGAWDQWTDELREAAAWIRIKLLTPYEEKAIERNGDI